MAESTTGAKQPYNLMYDSLTRLLYEGCSYHPPPALPFFKMVEGPHLHFILSKLHMNLPHYVHAWFRALLIVSPRGTDGCSVVVGAVQRLRPLTPTSDLDTIRLPNVTRPTEFCTAQSPNGIVVCCTSECEQNGRLAASPTWTVPPVLSKQNSRPPST